MIDPALGSIPQASDILVDPWRRERSAVSALIETAFLLVGQQPAPAPTDLVSRSCDDGDLSTVVAAQAALIDYATSLHLLRLALQRAEHDRRITSATAAVLLPVVCGAEEAADGMAANLDVLISWRSSLADAQIDAESARHGDASDVTFGGGVQ